MTEINEPENPDSTDTKDTNESAETLRHSTDSGVARHGKRAEKPKDDQATEDDDERFDAG